MMYVALLRGINVEEKFSEVKTYINSGNVIFNHQSHNTKEMTVVIEEIIKEKFLLDIAVTIRSKDELKRTIEEAPLW